MSPWCLGPKQPADPERAEQNQAEVRGLLARKEPAEAELVEFLVRDLDREIRTRGLRTAPPSRTSRTSR